MNPERFVKPRVFLSHSKKDSAFIERLDRALRLCQIDPWLDTFEIRHGRPWLSAIFEDGIPTCDSVIVYLTSHSLESAVVKKELDASVISQLADNSVALLPYVDRDELRGKVRVDIRALQIPEWNDGNFHIILAQCVAEVWRSFHEREIRRTIAEEKLRRVEAEKALETERKRKQPTYCGITYDEMKRQAFDFAPHEVIAMACGFFEVVPDVNPFDVAARLVQIDRAKFRKDVNGNREAFEDELYSLRERQAENLFSMLATMGVLVQEKDEFGAETDYFNTSKDGRLFFNRLIAELKEEGPLPD